MASWMVHLRIADVLLQHLKRIEKTEFVMGSMAPDSGVPNEDWSEYHPPKSVSHFQTKTGGGSVIDPERFCDRYFNERIISGYNRREFSFFFGYYAHLLTDVRWINTICASLKQDHRAEYACDKDKLYRAAKEDWYDLDFLYLKQHPDFCAFSIYENAVGFDNEYMDLFSRDAFENRRRYICAFYRSGEHGNLARDYRYLTPERAETFVKETSEWIAKLTDQFFKLRRED